MRILSYTTTALTLRLFYPLTKLAVVVKKTGNFCEHENPRKKVAKLDFKVEH